MYKKYGYTEKSIYEKCISVEISTDILRYPK